MIELIKELINEYREKKVKIILVKNDEKTILIHVITYFNKKAYIEDLEILKTFINKNEIRNNINILIHNSLERYLRGDGNDTDKMYEF